MHTHSIRPSLSALACLGLVGCTNPPDKDAWKAARPVGQPQDCIPIGAIQDRRIRDDRTIDFYMLDGRVYRNLLSYSCPDLGYEQSFSFATSLTQLCSTDAITVLHGPPRMTGARCALGQFQPIEGAPR